MKRYCVALLFCAAAAAQVAKNANSHYQTREGRETVAKHLSASTRDQEQRPQELVDSLSIQPGMTVADLGTGVGYMLPYLSKAVGPGGAVLAEDIFPDFLEKAAGKVKSEKLGNVALIQGTERDPKLPPHGVDLVFALEVYHHFNYPQEMLEAIRAALREGGRLAIVDFFRRPGAMPGADALSHIRIDQPEVVREIESNGFRLLSKKDHLPDSQYILIFEKGTEKGTDAFISK